MHKITDYIIKGKGIGALWLLLFSALFAFVSAYDLHKTLPQTVPYVQEFVDEFFPITIENSKVVAPEETVKTHTYDFGGTPFVVTLDTTRDILEEGAKQGIYITKSYIYSVTNDEVRRQNLVDIKLEKKDYTPIMFKLISFVVWTAALVGPFFNFLCFLIAVLFYAFCSGLACSLNRKTMLFKSKMRLNTLLFIGLYILTIILNFAGLHISTLAFFLIMIALQIVVIKKLPA